MYVKSIYQQCLHPIFHSCPQHGAREKEEKQESSLQEEGEKAESAEAAAE